MENRRKVYISIGEWQYKRKHQEYYTGYVIGAGYAYVTEKPLTVPYKSNQAVPSIWGITPYTNYLEGIIQYNVIKEQQLDTSEEAIKESFPETAIRENDLFFSADVRSAAWVTKHPFIATEIGEYERGSTNISTNAVRFATRSTDKDSISILSNGDGAQINAFRHVIWQSYITNKFGYEIAMQVGNVHEANPEADISQRRFGNLAEADQIIDLLNNKIGRKIGGSVSKNTKMNTMALWVLDAFYEDGFYTATPNSDGTFYVDRTKITDEQYEQLKSIFEKVNVFGRTTEEQKEINKQEEEKAQKKLEQLQRTGRAIP